MRGEVQMKPRAQIEISRSAYLAKGQGSLQPRRAWGRGSLAGLLALAGGHSQYNAMGVAVQRQSLEDKMGLYLPK